MYSMLILSTDLASPLIKNKMTKREFIRNVSRINAAGTLTPDYLGQLYDYIFLQARVWGQARGRTRGTDAGNGRGERTRGTDAGTGAETDARATGRWGLSLTCGSMRMDVHRA